MIKYICVNNKEHLIAWCPVYGWYCLECKCGQDTNLIEIKIEEE